MSTRSISPAALVVVAALVTGCAHDEVWRKRQDLATHDRPAASPLERLLPAAARGQGRPLARDDSKETSAQNALALARMLERRNEDGRARQLYAKAIEKDAGNPVPHHRLGVLSAKAGQYDEAHRHFETALQLSPSDPKLLGDLGYACYLEGKGEQAEEYLRRALELKPDDPAACHNLARLLADQDRYRESLDLLRRTGSSAEAHAKLGFLLAQRGELEKARVVYERALTLDPTHRPAAEALVQLVQRSRAERALTAGRSASIRIAGASPPSHATPSDPPPQAAAPSPRSEATPVAYLQVSDKAPAPQQSASEATPQKAPTR